MLHGVEWLGRQYSQLSKPTGGNASVQATLDTIATRLADSASDPRDVRASILTIRGLSRDHPQQTGKTALGPLVDCLVKINALNTPRPKGVEVDRKDAETFDEETVRAVVEACLSLCDVVGQQQQNQQAGIPGATKTDAAQAAALSHKHVDTFLTTATPLHALLPLLSPTRPFYTRFASLQLLAALLRARPGRVQDHVLVSPGGCGAILDCLAEGAGSSAEIVRNEALLLIPQLVAGNADIQKLVAFEGAFEKLLDVIAQEGRIEGGVIAEDALAGLDALLKYNVSNQNYFRETVSIPMLAPLLFYPPPPPAGPNGAAAFASRQSEQEHARQLEAFAFQDWDDLKLSNARTVVRIAGMLVEGPGDGRKANQNAFLTSGLTKCLFELSLASVAPLSLKAQALHVLAHILRGSRPNQEFLSSLLICPLHAQVRGAVSPGPESNQSPDGGHGVANDSDAAASGLSVPAPPAYEFSRLPARPAILVLIELAVSGPGPNFGTLSEDRGMRVAALDAFEALVADHLDARLAILGTMAPAEGEEQVAGSAGSLLLEGLSTFPSAESLDPYKHLVSCLLFCSLIRGSETAKKLAREIRFGPDGKTKRRGAAPAGRSEDDDDDEDASLIQVLVGNLTLVARESADAMRYARGGAAAESKKASATDWTRVQVGYLLVLSVWLFDSPASVRDLLSESANLQVLIQPVAQGGSGGDALVQALCAFVLGAAYEFDMPYEEEGVGEIQPTLDRAALQPILVSRIGVDLFATRVARLREDARIAEASPDMLERISSALTSAPLTRAGESDAATGAVDIAGELNAKDVQGLWLDWPFVEFWKTNYIQISRSVLVDPATTSSNAVNASAELVDARKQIEEARDLATRRALELDVLEGRLKELERSSAEERQALQTRLSEQDAALASHASATSSAQALASEHASSVEGLRAELAAASQRAEQAEREAREAKAAVEAAEAKAAAAAAAAPPPPPPSEPEKAPDPGPAADANALETELSNLKTELEGLRTELEAAKTRATDAEKENEDLLVLLDELGEKRKRDKGLLKEKGVEVSDDEEDEDDGEEEEG